MFKQFINSVSVKISAKIDIRITSYNVCYTKLLRDLNKEIAELNELQAAVLQSIEGNKANNITIDGMFNEMMLLYDRKLLLQAEYNSLQSFKVINNNMIFDAENSLMKSLLLFSVIGLFFGVVVSSILEVRRKVKLKQSETK